MKTYCRNCKRQTTEGRNYCNIKCYEERTAFLRNRAQTYCRYCDKPTEEKRHYCNEECRTARHKTGVAKSKAGQKTYYARKKLEKEENEKRFALIVEARRKKFGW